MANYINHQRTRTRTYELSQLSASILPQLKSIPLGASFELSWSRHREQVLKRRFTLREHHLEVESEHHTYSIVLDQTTLTYGKRLWYRCPLCNRRCGILYHSGIFACRRCVKATYQSQNGSITDAMADRIRRKREKLWHDMDKCFTNDLLESCYWWCRPKGKHINTFERERDKLIELEARYVNNQSERCKRWFAAYSIGSQGVD